MSNQMRGIVGKKFRLLRKQAIEEILCPDFNPDRLITAFLEVRRRTRRPLLVDCELAKLFVCYRPHRHDPDQGGAGMLDRVLRDIDEQSYKLRKDPKVWEQSCGSVFQFLERFRFSYFHDPHATFERIQRVMRLLNGMPEQIQGQAHKWIDANLNTGDPEAMAGGLGVFRAKHGENYAGQKRFSIAHFYCNAQLEPMAAIWAGAISSGNEKIAALCEAKFIRLFETCMILGVINETYRDGPVTALREVASLVAEGEEYGFGGKGVCTILLPVMRDLLGDRAGERLAARMAAAAVTPRGTGCG